MGSELLNRYGVTTLSNFALLLVVLLAAAAGANALRKRKSPHSH